MSGNVSADVAAPIRSEGASRRVASLDIFRGLTMAVMIFVNDVGEVHGLPWWTYHAKKQWNVMTYVDMVFPFFLFIVGMSMPLAIERRLKQNPSYAALWRYIGLRAAGLIVLGLILANGDKGDAVRMGISNAAWTVVGLAGAILFWLVPDRDPRHRRVYQGLRVVGLLILIVVFAIFRRTTAAGNVAWIDGSYPEILGLIGYTYFAVAVLYVSTRRWMWAPLAWFALLITFCALQTARILPIPETLPLYFWPFSNGAWASMTMAGIVTSIIFLSAHRWPALRQRMSLAAAFAAANLIAARFLAALGISKIRATPTWCLASVGAGVLVFVFLYYVCDVKGFTRWAVVVKPAGENTLLTYLLPDIYYYLAALAGFTYLGNHFSAGWSGVLSSITFTLMILAVSALLTRCRIKLQL